MKILKQIPWFDAAAWSPSRAISCSCFYVDGKWHSWLPINGKLQKMDMQPVESTYFGDKPERETDQCFELLNLAAQCISFTEMYRSIIGITGDFRNLATSLAKIRVFYEVSKTRHGVSRFVETEVEYMIYVCRSIFDLLQEMIAANWQRVQLLDTSVKKQQLPGSFTNVLFYQEKLRTSDEITAKYGLPKALADWYAYVSSFYVQIRELRDKIVHSGHSPIELLFSTERGFAIHRSEQRWGNWHKWPKDVELPNELVPIRPVLSTMAWNMIAVTDSFAQVLERTIQLPPPLFPGLKYYVRGHDDREFIAMKKAIEHSWWDDADADSVASAQPDGPPPFFCKLGKFFVGVAKRIHSEGKRLLKLFLSNFTKE